MSNYTVHPHEFGYYEPEIMSQKCNECDHEFDTNEERYSCPECEAGDLVNTTNIEETECDACKKGFDTWENFYHSHIDDDVYLHEHCYEEADRAFPDKPVSDELLARSIANTKEWAYERPVETKKADFRKLRLDKANNRRITDVKKAYKEWLKNKEEEYSE